MPLNLREIKGSALLHAELDDNFALRLAQSSHGFSLGDALYPDSATTWAKAQGDAQATLAEGIAAFVIDTNSLFIATLDGTVFTHASHGLGSSGSRLYLSQATAGLLTTTRPPTGFIQPVGKIISNDVILFRLGLLEELV